MLSPEPDRISIVYGALAVLICAITFLSGEIERIAGSVMLRCLAYGALCAAAVGLWLWLFPAIMQGLAGLIPAADVAAYFGAIDEMHGISPTLSGAGLLVPCLLAIAVALILSWRTRNLLWAYAAACGMVVVALAVSHIRFLGYAEAAAAAMLPVALCAVSAARGPAGRPRLLRRAVIAAFLIPPILPLVASAGGGVRAAAGEPCHVRDIAPALDGLGPAVVLTEISDTPEILWRTPVSTVGSLYHRSIGAFMAARAAWRSGPSAALPDTVRATGAAYILACDSLGRTRLIDDLPPSTLQDRLERHDVPAWLAQVAKGGGYRLYRIAK
jgi:branched-subunit amino acid transport protein